MNVFAELIMTGAGFETKGIVTRQGMALAALGLLIGAPFAYFVIRAVQSAIFTANVVDPVLVAGVTVTLLVVAFAATYLPALRASRVPPVTVLQAE